MTVLVTGAAGFIGMHVCERLLARGDVVLGLDNLNNYYDVGLKQARIKRLRLNAQFMFEHLDVADISALSAVFSTYGIERVVHLAAQAGVRYSLTNPQSYGSANLQGFLNILEASRHAHIKHLVYASSSSVYGGNQKLPFSEMDAVDHPVSLYAATKKANELMAHSYSHLYQLPCTGLRFFTVYGPWGRPDMSPLLFARAIFEGRPIDVFNHGKMMRDFTYIDDIVEGVVRVLDKPPVVGVDNAINPSGFSVHGMSGAGVLGGGLSVSAAPYRVFNIGNHQPVELLAYIGLMENLIGKPAIKEFKPLQAGDMLATYADTQALSQWVGFAPSTPLAVGLQHLVQWVQAYYGY